MCVCVWIAGVCVWRDGTPVASFPAARREPAFRLLFNKPADGAYWLWMDRDPPLGETGEEERGGSKCRERKIGRKGNKRWKRSHVVSVIRQFTLVYRL